jgi:hypothetical protein
MCETIPGELLLSFHRRDVAAQGLVERLRGGAIEHVTFVDTLRDRLFQMGLHQQQLELDFCRVRVPEGQEAFKINYLQFFYKHELLHALGSGQMSAATHGEILGRSDFHLQIVPHSWMSVASYTPLGFQLDAIHNAYTSMVGMTSSTGTGKDRALLLLDTGIDKTSRFNLISERNFVDPANAHDAHDDAGHGTVIASIIRDICPDAQIIAFKVADASGRASEWDLLAGLAARTTAHVVNISLAFGLGGTKCVICGRESHQSRSAVFENLVDQVRAASQGPLIVAAAGNETKSELAFPARFGNILAIQSVNSQKHLSQFSNRSTLDEAGQRHDNVFLAPGGDDAAPQESVGASSRAQHYWGTSFSAAYASGLLLRTWSEPANLAKDRNQILDELRAHADRSFAWYDPSIHGNGVLSL